MSDPIRAARAPAHEQSGPWADAIASAEANAPYLARIIARRADLLSDLDEAWPERVVTSAVAEARAIAAAPPEMEEAMSRLRRAKQGVHLALAIADLARAWPTMRITQALCDFADAACQAALALAAEAGKARGDLVAPADASRGPVPGMALIAMGKMGAGELNYSSDIDVSIFYEPSLLPVAEGREPSVVSVRLVPPFVRALEEITGDGYVFRTDLRLRPDPGATPTAVSIRSAEHYYQHLGQNWERAAFIKARVCAGDEEVGQEFLESLTPFIWRRNLDYAAVADVQSIKRQILTTYKSADLDSAIFDVKLGRGGIRDIELFAQTQQLILGGRRPELRKSDTLGALAALCENGVIGEAERDTLSEAYLFYRDVEHRIQMLEDAHTHAVPADAETRTRLAALCGFDDLAAFERALVERRAIVSEIDHSLFGRSESLADPMGSLVFTGVEDHPETLKTIAALGFSDPARVSQTIRGWHHGRIRAMRAERARELLTALTPKLLRALADTGEPDQAFARFSDFFAGLVGGVQVLSLLAAEPRLLSTLANAFGLAPKLAESLARRPALMDALIERRFFEPLDNDPPGARLAELQSRIEAAQSFEGALNAARRFQREESFRIGLQVLEGKASAAAAGAAYSDLAQACVEALADAALAETQRLFGKPPSAFSVLALGKFGGRELAEGSDLDIMIVYDEGAANEKGVGAGDFYTRFTQRLISALSAPTEEGQLYEVDMQLRPSGSKGPVAVRFSSFERYYAEEAWTWELLALTRLRPVAGDAALGARILDVRNEMLTRPRDADKIRADAADMRARMERERRGAGLWDLKLSRGGFVDLEFIAQTLMLVTANRDALSENTGAAFDKLQAAGALMPATAASLKEAWTLFSDLQQILRISVSGAFEPEHASESLKQRLVVVGGAKDFAELARKMTDARLHVREAFEAHVG